MARFKITIPKDRCKGCGLCVFHCPKKILAMSKKKTNIHGYFFVKRVKFGPGSCTGCAKCALTCPDTIIEIEKFN